MNINLTEASKKLFSDLVNDAPNWSGHPYIGGNVSITKQERGNLTQLKVEGLLETEHDPDAGMPYVIFTAKGKQYAQSLGLDGLDTTECQ